MVRIPIDEYRGTRRLGGGILLILWAGLMSSAAPLNPEDYLPLAVMLVGALVLLGYRRYLEIDREKKRLALRVGVFHGFVRKSFHLDIVRRLAIKSVTSRHERGGKTTRYAICIGGMGGPELCEFADMWRARLITEQLSRALSVTMQNRLLGGSSTRSSSELDLALAERWRLDGRHKEAPRLPPGSVLTLELHESHSELSAPIEMAVPRAHLVALLAASLFLLGGFFYLIEDARGFILFIGTCVIATLGAAIARMTGRDRIRFDAHTVRFRRGLWPSQSMRLDEIEEILSNRTDVVLMGDRKYIRLRKPASEADADLQRQFIERQLAQRHRPGDAG